MDSTATATFGAAFAALYIAHTIGDHWVIAAPAVSTMSRVVRVEVAR